MILCVISIDFLLLFSITRTTNSCMLSLLTILSAPCSIRSLLILPQSLPVIISPPPKLHIVLFLATHHRFHHCCYHLLSTIVSTTVFSSTIVATVSFHHVSIILVFTIFFVYHRHYSWSLYFFTSSFLRFYLMCGF